MKVLAFNLTLLWQSFNFWTHFGFISSKQHGNSVNSVVFEKKKKVLSPKIMTALQILQETAKKGHKLTHFHKSSLKVIQAFFDFTEKRFEVYSIHSNWHQE